MKILYFLSFMFFLVGTIAKEDTSTDPSTDSTTPEITSSPVPTTAPPTSEKPPEPTTTSTVQPKTTTEPTTPKTTTEPTTPKTTPETTTPKTTTPKTTTSETTTPETTTPQTTTPKTTTPAPKTTTPVPLTTKSPVPVPEEGTWNVTSGNTTCIRASLKILFKIFLPDREEYIALSPNASSGDSRCDGDASNVTQVLSLREQNYELRFIFEKKSDIVYVKNTSFTYYIDASETVTNNSQMFTVKNGNSYLCTVESDVLLGDNVTMEIMSIKIQAFGAENNHDFGTAEECDADNKVSDIVPIAVGIALLSLVVVVLVAYLIGRRRSRQRGYQSV